MAPSAMVPNASVRRTRKKELHSTDITIEQKDPIILPPLGESVVHESVIQPVSAEQLLEKAQLDNLAFAEEPVTVLIHPSSEAGASMVTDYVACLGIPAEVFLNGRWCQSNGYLPKGKPLTLKRKVVEILLRAKHDDVTHDYAMNAGKDPDNVLGFVTRMKYPLSIQGDTNPKSTEWFNRLVAQRV